MTGRIAVDHRAATNLFFRFFEFGFLELDFIHKRLLDVVLAFLYVGLQLGLTSLVCFAKRQHFAIFERMRVAIVETHLGHAVLAIELIMLAMRAFNEIVHVCAYEHFA